MLVTGSPYSCVCVRFALLCLCLAVFFFSHGVGFFFVFFFGLFVLFLFLNDKSPYYSASLSPCSSFISTWQLHAPFFRALHIDNQKVVNYILSLLYLILISVHVNWFDILFLCNLVQICFNSGLTVSSNFNIPVCCICLQYYPSKAAVSN